ncbi:hypothetical protein RHSIM_Rhsim03G0051600 [Rhododendron simsii]|uniref:Cwf19-like protein C-terminal domain-containing protein n=1 Tax=Rhododendron simsii TaxID=118357 RepID=A0A834H8L1_RHOSS|nr:hypothetical protein RHSIM_Rhsim03G0051600 [Rhododendron simsii]
MSEDGRTVAEEGIHGTGLSLPLLQCIVLNPEFLAYAYHVAVVAAASIGIGTEIARVLALHGVHVPMGVRSMDSGKEVKEAIVKEIPSAKIEAMGLDLSLLASVSYFTDSKQQESATRTVDNNVATSFLQAIEEVKMSGASPIRRGSLIKGLRGSVPKDFPYFHVEFGLNKGFVHVIDDEQQFKANFGLNVIRGGMLKLPEEDIYGRRKHDSEETQKQAVSSFARDWPHFDWTKKL